MLQMLIVLNNLELASYRLSRARSDNGCDVILGVCSALGNSFFVSTHKTNSLANTTFEKPL